MYTASTAVYRENRARFPLAELRKFDGQWVAFSGDGRQIVGSAPTIAELATRLQMEHKALGDVVLERIEFDADEVYLGGAELM